MRKRTVNRVLSNIELRVARRWYLSTEPYSTVPSNWDRLYSLSRAPRQKTTDIDASPLDNAHPRGV